MLHETRWWRLRDASALMAIGKAAHGLAPWQAHEFLFRRCPSMTQRHLTIHGRHGGGESCDARK